MPVTLWVSQRTSLETFLSYLSRVTEYNQYLYNEQRNS